MKNLFAVLISAFFLIPFQYVFTQTNSTNTKPNVVFILADDWGYGDVKCLNPNSKIATPYTDNLAKQGMIFTDAHTSSSVCTPSRYSLLTGRYNWRTKMQEYVLGGFSKPLIDPNRTTIASFLKQQGYNTAAIGKWHLGLDMPFMDGEVEPEVEVKRNVAVNWKGEIKNGPNTNGFDYFFGVSASTDMPPYIYIENNKFIGEATARKGINRKGQGAPDFDVNDVLPEIGRRTINFIKNQNTSTPYFAYVALTSPHTPIIPTNEWLGKSGLNKYADFVMQTDDIIGKIIAAIDSSGMANNTIIIISSDNGCSKSANIQELANKGHAVSYIYRGSKADLWDGGHRVPFIVRWPDKVKASSTSSALICQTDFFATMAEIIGANVQDNFAEDSQSFLPALLGKNQKNKARGIVHHAINGHFAYRLGKWKLLLAKGSGGWTSPTEKQVADTTIVAQLYNMENDPGETTNLYNKYPKIAAKLLAQLQKEVNDGRSTKGLPQKNDTDKIILWKNAYQTTQF
ncbi:MAG: sulfatase family protein [Chitinophagaceae bacterium]